MKKLLVIAGLCALLIWSCTSPTSSEEPEDTSSGAVMSVEARPGRVPADGVSTMVIFAEFRENGLPVPDSTRIILLNTIGTLGQGELYTQDGIVLDTLTADTVEALGLVIAVASGVRDSVEVVFEPVGPN